ncbi:MAG: hypothetical protein ACE5H4_15955 [Candidatus Thorarchaeota archaeon]
MNTRAASALILVLILAAGIIGFLVMSELGPSPESATTTTTTDPYAEYPSIEELLLSVFDGAKGFGDSEGENSTIESTLRAAELIHRYHLANSSLLEASINVTADYIKSHQEGSGRFYFGSDLFPDPTEVLETTVKCAKILNRLNRMDDTTMSYIRRYLGNFFRGGLAFDNWITDGVFEAKYWGLLLANETSVFGLILDTYPLTINENVFSRGDDIPPDTSPILYRNETYFPDYGFWQHYEPFSQRLMVLESFECMVKYRHERPTLINLLVDTTIIVDEILMLFDSTTGLFEGGLENHVRLLRLLASVGKIDAILNETVPQRLEALHSMIEDTVIVDRSKCVLGKTMTELLAMTQMHDILA